MKNTMFRLMIVCLLASSSIVFAMDERESGGKGSCEASIADLRGEVKKLQKLNAALTTNQRQAEAKIDQLNGQIESGKTYAQKLKIMTGAALSRALQIGPCDIENYSQNFPIRTLAEHDQHAMIHAMKVAQENPEIAAQFMSQMEVIKTLLQSRREY